MRDIRRILCPVDLSEVSCHVISHAVLFAQRYDAKITALHVWNPIVRPVSDLALIGPVEPPDLSPSDSANVRAEVLSRFVAGGAGEVEVQVDSGPPARRIVDLARSLPADLVVLGTHGIGGFDHLLLGSVTEKVLRRASCPVLTVPPGVRETSPLPFKHIVCPVDFSDSSRAALDFAFSLAQEGDGGLTILYVFEWTEEPLTTRPIASPEYRQALSRQVDEQLERLVPDSVRDWCRPTTRVVQGKPYREILAVAAEKAADLIVMGVHGRSTVDLMLFGSTTNQVVRRATCPVLTVRT